MLPNRRSLGRAARAARHFARGARGASMAEYALLLGVIALVAVVGAKTLGTTIRDGANLVAYYIRVI